MSLSILESRIGHLSQLRDDARRAVPALVAQNRYAVLVGEHDVAEGAAGDPRLIGDASKLLPLFLVVGESEVDSWDLEGVGGGRHRKNLVVSDVSGSCRSSLTP